MPHAIVHWDLLKNVAVHKEQRNRHTYTQTDTQTQLYLQDSREIQQVLDQNPRWRTSYPLFDIICMAINKNVEKVAWCPPSWILVENPLYFTSQDCQCYCKTRMLFAAWAEAIVMHVCVVCCCCVQLFQKIDFGTYFVYHNELLVVSADNWLQCCYAFSGIYQTLLCYVALHIFTAFWDWIWI